jgi:hypothetical protein
MGMPIGEAPRDLDIWYAEYRLEARLSKSPPFCSAASAFCCLGGGGGGGKLSTLSSAEPGLGGRVLSFSWYGGRTGIFCIVVLESVDSPEEIDALDWSLFGNPLRPEAAEDILGGTLASFVPSSRPSALLSGNCFDIPSFKIEVRPVLLLLTVLTLTLLFRGKEESPLPFALSLDCFCLSFCCFRLRPWSRFMIMSLILGKYFSKLSTLAS